MRLHRRHAEMGLRGTYADMRGTYADMCPAAAQGYRGWRYGYVDASTRMDNTSVFYEFVWNPSPENNQIADGKWTPGEVRHALTVPIGRAHCPLSRDPYPNGHRLCRGAATRCSSLSSHFAATRAQGVLRGCACHQARSHGGAAHSMRLTQRARACAGH